MKTHTTNHSTSADKPADPVRRKKRIAIFGSGRGSNAKQIIDHFKGHDEVEVALVLSDRRDAGILDHARYNKIPYLSFSKEDLGENRRVFLILHKFNIDLIILAGFLKLIPKHIIRSFDKKIVNIHPALLPKYGGKGMYGMNVHRAVKASGDSESGITIHFVNEAYDEGAIILQEKVAISPEDTADQIAEKVLELEHKYFAKTIENLLVEQG